MKIDFISKIKYHHILLAFIVGVGFLLRLYRFPHFPEFTDEIRESLVSYNLYSFKSIPLTSYSKYIGPIHGYFLAVFMWIFGINIWMPRIFILIIGLGSIGISYLFARKWSNKYVGLLVSFYTALSPTLILINSRISWATCSTPLVGGFIFYYLKKFKDELKSNQILILGALSGLMINLHPLMAFFVMPILIYILIIIFRNCRGIQIAKYIGLLGFSFVLMLLPMIIENIKDPNATVEGAVSQGNFSMDRIKNLTAEGYLTDLRRLSAQTEHLINNSIIFDGIIVPEYKYKPFLLIKSISEITYLLVLLGTFLIFVRRRWHLVIFPVSVLSLLLLSPILTSDYFEGTKIRYYSVLIPVFGFIIGCGLFELWMIAKKHAWLRILILLVYLIPLAYAPLTNLNNFFAKNDDEVEDVAIDSDFLQSLTLNQDKIYYVPFAERDNNPKYSLAEYLIKFSGLPENSIRPFNNEDGGILVLPNHLEDDSIEPLLDKLSNRKKIYNGASISVYH